MVTLYGFPQTNKRKKAMPGLKTALGNSNNIPDNTKLHQHLQVTGKTLSAASWTTDGSLKKYSLSDTNITADHIVDVIVANASADIAQVAQLLPTTNSVAGAVEIWAKNTPSGDITVAINIYLKS